MLYDLGRQPRAAHEFFVKYQDRILFGKDAFEPEEYPVLLARVRDQRRVLRLLPRLSRVLEALRHGPAGRRAEEALLPERAARRRPGCRKPAGRSRPARSPEAVDYVPCISSPAAPVSSAPTSSKNCCAAVHSVRIADNFSTGRRENVPAAARRTRRRRPRGRRPSPRAPSPAATIVIHQAAIPSVPRSVKDPVGSHRANVDAHAARAHRGARRRRQARRVRRLVIGLRRPPVAAEARRHARRARCRPTRCRSSSASSTARCSRALRPRDGDDAVLQCVRAAAAAGLAVLGRDLAVHRSASRGRSPTSTATAARRATLRTSPTS